MKVFIFVSLAYLIIGAVIAFKWKVIDESENPFWPDMVGWVILWPICIHIQGW